GGGENIEEGKGFDQTTNVVTVAPINLSGEGEAKEPYCIAQHNIDATDSAQVGTAWLTGMFNAHAVILPESAKIADVYLACRKVGIFLNTAQQNPSA
ncbi:hypothetical protein J4V87_24710, partial [Escherichia coli]